MSYPYVQIHTLRSFPPHIPNRGGDGLAKRAIIGGVERQRISYQALGYALRETGAIDSLSADHTIRSREISERLILPALTKAGLSDAEAWALEITRLWLSDDAAKKHTDLDLPQPVVVGEQEVRLLTAVALAMATEGLAPAALRPLFAKKTLPKDTPEAVRTAVEAVRIAKATSGIGAALFGRMATGIALSNVDRAVRLSDWLSTHPITTVGDFFSTADDLREEAGMSHISTRELGAGLFYHHTLLDAEQAKRNGTDPVAVAPWLVEALAATDPLSGRGQSRLVGMMVELGSSQPGTLFDAFIETPAWKGSDALGILKAFATEQDSLVGGPDVRLWLDEQDPANGSKLAALTDAVRQRMAA
jgi:CRISPR system Cascade subunit CasC